jgi:lipopolysaccharide/colanic/teichoic acid biosynthesis glycosyltransferase
MGIHFPAGACDRSLLILEVIPLTIKTRAEQARPDVLPLDVKSRNRPRRAPDGRHFSRVAVVPRRRWYVRCKTVLDFVAALLLLVPAVPLILIAGLLVKVTSRGPIFYTQRRVGRAGRIFTIYKIRTMVHDCESLTGPRWAIPGDPRVIRVGQFLRLTHLDELPQLVNVLRGDMSLIGPRPERPEFLPGLERALPSYRSRLNVRPGVTGLAQIKLAPDTDLSSVRRKLAYDLHYVQEVSFWLDLRILICTGLKIIGDPGQLSRYFRLVPQGETIERGIELTAPANTVLRPRTAA